MPSIIILSHFKYILSFVNCQQFLKCRVSVSAGLPNITGYAADIIFNKIYVIYGGIFKSVINNGTFWDSNKGDSYVGDRRHVELDASKANALYGKSTTVTPLSLKCKFYIKF